MDISAHQRIHLVPSGGDGANVLPRQGRKNKPIGHVNAELITAAASTGVESSER
jgi:hypothetical protein